MSWFDFVIVGLVAVSTYWSYSQGIILEITFFVGTILGLLFAFLFYPRLTPFFASILDGEILSATVAFVLIFLVTGVLITVAGLFVQKFMGALQLRGLDRLLGGIAGFLKSVVGVAVLVVMISGMYPDDPPDYLADSLLARPIVEMTTGSMESVPAVFSNFLEDYANPALESLETLRNEAEDE